jgi:hypothetical protein
LRIVRAASHFVVILGSLSQLMVGLLFWFLLLYSSLNILWFVLAFIAFLAEASRVPFDLSEAESELVAGFTTEYSSIYFSVLILTEYINVIVGTVILTILFCLPTFLITDLLYWICILRCSLVRLKFDELLSLSWSTFLIISFGLLTVSIINNGHWPAPCPMTAVKGGGKHSIFPYPVRTKLDWFCEFCFMLLFILLYIIVLAFLGYMFYWLFLFDLEFFVSLVFVLVAVIKYRLKEN